MSLWNQAKQIIGSTEFLAAFLIIIASDAIDIIRQPNIKYEEFEYPIEFDVAKIVHIISLKNTGYSTASDVKVLVTTTNFAQQYNGIKPKTLCRIDKSPGDKQITYSCDKLASGAEVLITIPAPIDDPTTIEIEVSHNGNVIKEKPTPLKYILIGIILGMLISMLGRIRFKNLRLTRKLETMLKRRD